MVTKEHRDVYELFLKSGIYRILVYSATKSSSYNTITDQKLFKGLMGDYR
jgi:hypothetical protein